MADIHIYLTDIFNAQKKRTKKHGNWYARLKPFFDRIFSSGWKAKDKTFWDDFDTNYIISKEELEIIL